MSETYLREACIDSLEEAIRAQRQGADRIEFCSRLDLDGLTPDFREVGIASKDLSLPIMAMVRPRPGNFEYSRTEFDLMKKEVAYFKKLGVKGVVFGILRGREIDVERTKELAQLAAPMEVCFHKAIDEVDDPIIAVQKLNLIPEITRILTSGQRSTALEGIDTIKAMMSVARENLSIMPAGKVNGSNIAVLHKALNAKEYHGKSILVNY